MRASNSRTPNRLGHVIVGPKLQAHDLVQFLALGREHEDGGGELPGAKLLANVVAAHPGQHDVEHDQPGAVPGAGLHRLVAAVAHGNLETVALEHFFQAQQDVRVVFHDEDFGFHFFQVHALAPAATGRRRLKQLPPPGRGS